MSEKNVLKYLILEVELPSLTHREVTSNVDGLVAKLRSLREQRDVVEREVERQQKSLDNDIPKLKKLVNLGIQSFQCNIRKVSHYRNCRL